MISVIFTTYSFPTQFSLLSQLLLLIAHLLALILILRRSLLLLDLFDDIIHLLLLLLLDLALFVFITLQTTIGWQIRCDDGCRIRSGQEPGA